MEGAGFRSLIIFLLLAILAFVAGSLASENAVGALVPTALVLGLFFLIYLGKNCWVLVFIVPPIFSVVDLSFLKGLPVPYIICGIILFYMFILYMMGYVRIKWNGVLLIDVISLVFCLYLISTYIRHPVTVKAFTSITDFGYADIGGKEYIYLAACILSYLSLSIISVSFETLIKTLKWAFWVSAFFVLVTTVQGIMGGGITFGEEVSTSRYSGLSYVSRFLFNYLFAKYSILGIVLSPSKLALVLLSVAGILLSGFRSLLLSAFFYVFFMTCIYKQFCVFVLMGLTAWGALVYVSHEDEDIFNELPFGIQRAMTVLPGVKLSDKIEKEAEGSSDWRLEMWEWALDPSTGYIKDYVWGDGFGLSSYREKLRTTAVALRTIQNDNKLFAARGAWHNGAIHLVHRTGYVGLSIVYIWALVAIAYMYKVCCWLRPVDGREYVYIIFVPIFESIFVVWFLPCDTIFFITKLYELALCKILYLGIKKEFPNLNQNSSKTYIPQIFHDLNQSVKMRIS